MEMLLFLARISITRYRSKNGWF